MSSSIAGAAVVCAGGTVSSSLKRISSLTLEMVYSVSDIGNSPNPLHNTRDKIHEWRDTGHKQREDLGG